MRIVFMGSAGFACPSLERLLATAGLHVVGVVTQPDRPRGRHQQTAACPVAELARRHGANVVTPENVNTPESLAALRELRPDMIVVVAYGQILRQPILLAPSMGCLNLHGSLLPRYRGAAPIQWAIANGDATTGVTVMFMNERMDAGDILVTREVPIGPEDTGGTLAQTMSEIGAELLAEGISAVHDGRATRVVQDETKATIAPKLTKQDGKIDWSMSAVSIHNRVRAFNPWPGGWMNISGPRGDLVLRVLRTRVEPMSAAVPGTVSAVGNDGPLVAAGRDAVRLIEVQPEGKRPMRGSDFLRGHQIQVGQTLG